MGIIDMLSWAVFGLVAGDRRCICRRIYREYARLGCATGSEVSAGTVWPCGPGRVRAAAGVSSVVWQKVVFT